VVYQPPDRGRWGEAGTASAGPYAASEEYVVGEEYVAGREYAPGREYAAGREIDGRRPRPVARPAARVPVPPVSQPATAVDAAAGTAAAKFAYNPSLDGLRAIAIFFVLGGHMGAIRASNVAVDLFFVLSGFLITALLLAEHARTGAVSIRRFLVRRAYRLLPAMWVYLIIGLAVTVAFKWDDVAFREDYFGSAVSSFFNVNNWFRIENPDAGGRWLAHVWSLSLEEQFYLIWPAVFALALGSQLVRRWFIPIIGVMIAAVVIWCYLLTDGGAARIRLYFGLDTHVAPLLFGCLLAIWRDSRLRVLGSAHGAADTAAVRTRRRHAPTSGKVSQATAAAAARWTSGRRLAAFGLPAAVALVVIAFVGPDKSSGTPNWLDYSGYVVGGALGALVILACDMRRDAGWVRLLGGRGMAWTGKRAYSIFLWHYPVISAASGQLVPRIGLWPSVVVAGVVSTGIAAVSTRLVEQPTQRRRPKWADAPRGPKAAPRPSGSEQARVPATMEVPATRRAPATAPGAALAATPPVRSPGSYAEYGRDWDDGGTIGLVRVASPGTGQRGDGRGR
jgi:peptidoglycan/LPS O-acetylase OafA/YrhL